ncbi:hypothetical protein GCM10007415_18990 [Parapedobacter pyrenivorans]|uniref:Uncharacterized protein n=1 Tax=Parapedobacter pyrenivorans TaxID=1305674 RepID=A0A917M9D8_9SPHI|nr:hypothetical protein [Parapedobacter pyrenivorans]GGG85798.1 hypothetical protein GCM10007415_18990 [Parapedobacter pyrenivorans]
MVKKNWILYGVTLMSLVSMSLRSSEKPQRAHADDRFVDHGVASPVSTNRGVVATVDGQGRNIVMAWLFDVRGGYSLLVIDEETGESEEFPMPFDTAGDSPFSSLFSSQGKLYTLFNGNFVEFDPETRAYTFHKKTAPQMAMGMTEDDQGRIWAVTYPNSGLVCYDPEIDSLTDYGYVNKENWAQYQRYMAADDTGWIYFALGNTNSQLLAFNPDSREVRPLLPTTERKRGMAYVYRNRNGKVFGQALQDDAAPWYELYQGNIVPIGVGHRPEAKNIITGSQALRHLVFPDGRRIVSLDLIDRQLTTEDAAGNAHKTVNFDYSTEGSWVMGVATSPDRQSIIGGSSFPMRLFNHAVANESWSRESAFGQFNAIAVTDRYAFFGSYPGGHLMIWDPQKPFTGTVTGREGNNPEVAFTCKPIIYRPHRVLAHPNDRTIMMSGTPDYGYTGGGLLFYDMKSREHVLLTDSQVVENQSTMSLTTLKNGKVLGGTTIAPGTGGERKATLAELYQVDVNTKQVEWRKPVIPGVQTYSDLATRADGKVYGIADYKLFFVFDPEKQVVIYQKDVSIDLGRTVGEQSPRIFVKGAGEDLYLLFHDAITKVNHDSYQLTLLAHTPEPVRAGGDYLNNRIYYISGSHLYSYAL